jgi:hypothetical protein
VVERDERRTPGAGFAHGTVMRNISYDPLPSTQHENDDLIHTRVD